jgi:hypothetical protein
LQHAFNRALGYQDQVEKQHEAAFKKSLHEHQTAKVPQECCLNVRKGRGPLGTRKEGPSQKKLKEAEERVEIAPIVERESLISHTLWMFGKVQLSLETFQPVIIG